MEQQQHEQPTSTVVVAAIALALGAAATPLAAATAAAEAVATPAEMAATAATTAIPAAKTASSFWRRPVISPVVTRARKKRKGGSPVDSTEIQ